MFFLVTLSKDVQMHPSSFGPRIHDAIKRQLRSDVEGTVHGTYGFIIVVTSVKDIPLGEVQEGGMVKFYVKYDAIVFRPFRNQVLDAVVESVDGLGIRANAGPLSVFIYKDHIPSDMTYDSSIPAYTMSDTTDKIQAGELIRLKITGLRFDASEIVCKI
uniref:S1 motif domain-containing protein n=1 Tax=Arcella intermedia TaxID=1963864 RepID=A0A6B2LN88_9EUKA